MSICATPFLESAKIINHCAADRQNQGWHAACDSKTPEPLGLALPSDAAGCSQLSSIQYTRLDLTYSDADGDARVDTVVGSAAGELNVLSRYEDSGVFLGSFRVGREGATAHSRVNVPTALSTTATGHDTWAWASDELIVEAELPAGTGDEVVIDIWGDFGNCGGLLPPEGVLLVDALRVE